MVRKIQVFRVMQCLKKAMLRATLQKKARTDMAWNIRERVFKIADERKMGIGRAVQGSYVPDSLDPSAFQTGSDGPASGEVVLKSQDVPAPQEMGVSKPWQRGNWNEKLFTEAQHQEEHGWHVPAFLPLQDGSMAGRSGSSRRSWLQNTTSHFVNGKEYRSYPDDDVRYSGISFIGFAPDGVPPVWVKEPPSPNVASVGV